MVAGRAKHPRIGTTNLRKRFPSLYAALYRRDRTWLKKNCPPKIKRAPRRIRVDWAVRDAELSKKILAVERLLRASIRPQQITATSLLRAAGGQIWESKLALLPKSRKLLKRLSEKRIEFACRRVRHVTRKNMACGRRLNRWQLQRQVRLRSELLRIPIVAEIFESSLHQLAMAAERRN